MMKLQFCCAPVLAMCVATATAAAAATVPGVCMDAAHEANCNDVACLRALDALPTICQLALQAAAAETPSRRLRARDLLAEGCPSGSDPNNSPCVVGNSCQSGYCGFPPTGAGPGTCSSTCVVNGQRVAQGNACSCCSGETTAPDADNRSLCGPPPN